jgi:hypothetical protein
MTGQLHRADFVPPAGLANRHVQALLPRLLPRRHLLASLKTKTAGRPRRLAAESEPSGR